MIARQCHREDKLIFKTKRGAEVFLRSLRNSPDYRGLAVYRCVAHRGWHVGHRS